MAPQAKLRENVDGNKMDLSMSGLTEVPVKDISVIKKATNLDLSNNQLTALPSTFCTLTHLIELDLSKNMISELPEEFGNLTNLKRLDLYGNKLTHLPLSFCHLKALKWLDLKNNPLVPKLAEIAGPCGDAQQCQQCARNVVSMLTQTAIKVEEDRKRLLEERLREQELIEQEILLKKKELDAENGNKKSKKKTKKGKSEKQSHDESEKRKLLPSEKQLDGKKGDKMGDSKGSKKSRGMSSPSGFWKSALKFVTRFLVLIGLSAIILFISSIIFAAYDRKSFLQFVEGLNIASNDFTHIILYCAKYVEYTLKHSAVREMRSQLVVCFRSIIASILNIYKTICQEFPIYYDVLKSKFV